MAPPQLRPFIDAIVARLDIGGLEVGNAHAPDVDPPYVVVWLIGGGEVSGTIAAPVDDAELLIQLTCVGDTPNGAQWAADKSRDLLVGWQPVVSGRSIEPLQLTMASGGVTRDDDTPEPLWYAIERYTALSFPA